MLLEILGEQLFQFFLSLLGFLGKMIPTLLRYKKALEVESKFKELDKAAGKVGLAKFHTPISEIKMEYISEDDVPDIAEKKLTIKHGKENRNGYLTSRVGLYTIKARETLAKERAILIAEADFGFAIFLAEYYARNDDPTIATEIRKNAFIKLKRKVNDIKTIEKFYDLFVVLDREGLLDLVIVTMEKKAIQFNYSFTQEEREEFSMFLTYLRDSIDRILSTKKPNSLTPFPELKLEHLEIGPLTLFPIGTGICKGAPLTRLLNKFSKCDEIIVLSRGYYCNQVALETTILATITAPNLENIKNRFDVYAEDVIITNSQTAEGNKLTSLRLWLRKGLDIKKRGKEFQKQSNLIEPFKIKLRSLSEFNTDVIDKICNTKYCSIFPKLGALRGILIEGEEYSMSGAVEIANKIIAFPSKSFKIKDVILDTRTQGKVLPTLSILIKEE